MDTAPLALTGHFFRTIIASSRDVIAVVAADATIRYISPSVRRIFGYEPAELLGRRFTEYVHPDDHSDSLRHLASAVAHGETPAAAEHRFRRKDGAWSLLESEGRSALGDPKVGGIVVTARDVTERSELQSRLKRSLLATIGSLATALDKRDPYTAGHQRRVARLAGSIAEELRLDAPRIEGLRLAATIHDIGKIQVPAEILSKPGRLNEAEFGLIRNHPQVGFDIVDNVELPWPLARMILEHHERCDGSGYPRGLRRDEMLPESRILAVADVVEAMSSHRPYRASLGIEAALRHVDDEAGKLYDREVAEACVTLVRARGFDWDRGAGAAAPSAP